MVDWVKQNSLLGGALCLWLLALSPVGNLGKAVCYCLALGCAVESIHQSRKLIKITARNGAIAAMNLEIEQLQLALEAHTQQQALHEIYGTSGAEVEEEVRKSLEHLYNEPSGKNKVETSTSKQQLYLAIKALMLAEVPETFIIENVLKMGGRNWDKGKEFLQELLQEGETQGWG